VRNYGQLFIYGGAAMAGQSAVGSPSLSDTTVLWLQGKVAALEAEVASLRIAQQANTAICPVSAMQCVRARVIVECQTPDAPCQHRGKQQ